MEKTYQPKLIEQALYPFWEAQGFFKPKASGMPYCIMLPPPNVTGSLHMGHGFQHTLMDILTRYHRMQGDNTLWQPGTDHAGIATQMVVENQLHAQKKTRHDLGREAFVERVWTWKQESGGNITRQMRRLGTSPDWSRERFTLDQGLSDAVQTAFIKLYNDGLIYRGKRLVNWDPILRTAVSDLEVNNIEEQGSLWHIRYPLVSGQGSVTVATTRPETLLGDVAVAVHPDDERYQQWIGQSLTLPLCNRTIPIIADDSVDPAFGTGCVKITPAHDFNDYEVGKRHQLPLINILTPDAHLNSDVPQAYQGLERFAARKRIVADLEAQGFLVKIDPHTLKVPRNDRGSAVLEPYLMDQWYVRAAPLAAPAIKAVEEGRMRFIPEQWSNTYFEWMRNIQDWCISRQLWWGHRIPAWYDADGRIYVGENEAAVRKQHQLAADVTLRQDEDVLDTWFSSALWPFSTLGWPHKTPELKAFYPTSVLVTGFDIIFFWVARMMMFGLHFIGDVPFREVYITGLIRDAEGQKMSKTKGNVLDPIDLIDGISLDDLIAKRTYGMMQPKLADKISAATRKEFPQGIPAFGTDALRFTYCALASTSRDILFNIQRMEGYRNFCNKLWNATRFVLMQVESCGFNLNAAQTLSVADHWILHKLNEYTHTVHQALAQYRFDLVAEALYELVWNQYCDWYLELAKVTLNHSSDPAVKNGTCRTLLTVLETALRLAHPIIPFITESIWQTLKPIMNLSQPSIMVSAYPKAQPEWEDPAATAEITWLQKIITTLRTLRSELKLNPGQTMTVLVKGVSPTERERIERNSSAIQALAKVQQWEWLSQSDTPPPSATALFDSVELLVPLAGLIDTTAERERLHKAIAKLDADIARIETKLANADFVAKAPEAVISKEKARLEEAKAARVQMQQQAAALVS